MVQLLPRVTVDQHIVQTGRSWEQFKSIQKGFENSPGVRLFYFDETIEILMPGQAYETFASIIGCLLMLFLSSRGVPFVPTR